MNTMQKSNEDIKLYILSEFPRVKTAEDLLRVLNTIRAKLYAGGTEDNLNLKQLMYLTVPSRKRYYTFDIKKKSGKKRTISAPCERLKVVQTCINEILKVYYDQNDHACGFIPGKSIVDGAERHANQHYVLNIDLKDFFDSVEYHQVRALFTAAPFNLPDTKEHSTPANILAALCCQTKMVERVINGEVRKVSRFVTPQGAPTSPMLTNLVCRSLDKRLTGLARQFGAQYSRYADDITFSHSKNIFRDGSVFRQQMETIVSGTRNLRINSEKTRLQGRHYRQEVTGLTVNEKVNVSRRYIQDLKKWIYFMERYGVKRANVFYQAAYMKEKGHIKQTYPGIAFVMRGKLEFLKMVRGAEDPLYKKLSERLHNAPASKIAKLTSAKNANPNPSINNILKALIESL